MVKKDVDPFHNVCMIITFSIVANWFSLIYEIKMISRKFILPVFQTFDNLK